MPSQQRDSWGDQSEQETLLEQRLLGSEPVRAPLPQAGAPVEFPVPRISFGVTEAVGLLEQLQGYAEERNLWLEELLEAFLEEHLL